MANSLFKIKSCPTLTKKDFVEALLKDPSYESESRRTCARAVDSLLSWMAKSLVDKRSISLMPSGHLVVSKRAERTVIFPNAKMSTVREGYWIRLRKSPDKNGTLKTQQAAKELAVEIELSTEQGKALFTCFKRFLSDALKSSCRVELRGLGSFNLHEKEASPVFNPGLGRVVSKKSRRYFNFIPSKKLTEKLQGQK